MRLSVMRTSSVFVSSQENHRKNNCAPKRAPEERNGCDIALHQAAPRRRVSMPSDPHAEIADQIESSSAQHVCGNKTPQANPLTQEPSCKGNGSKGRNLEDHFPA